MYWWMRIDGYGHLEPAPIPAVGYQLEQLADPTFTPDFSGCNFRFIRDESVGTEIMDFARYLNPAFFIRERAFHALEEYFLKVSKPFSLSCEGIIYYFIKIDVELDLIDYELSEYSLFDTFDSLEDGISMMTRVIIKHPPPGCPEIFRLKGGNGVRKNIIVSDRFKRTYEENELTGLYFRPAEPLPN